MDYLESAKTDADNLPAGAEHGQPKGRMNRSFELDVIMSKSLSADAVLSIENTRPARLGIGFETAPKTQRVTDVYY